MQCAFTSRMSGNPTSFSYRLSTSGASGNRSSNDGIRCLLTYTPSATSILTASSASSVMGRSEETKRCETWVRFVMSATAAGALRVEMRKAHIPARNAPMIAQT